MRAANSYLSASLCRASTGPHSREYKLHGRGSDGRPDWITVTEFGRAVSAVKKWELITARFIVQNYQTGARRDGTAYSNQSLQTYKASN